MLKYSITVQQLQNYTDSVQSFKEWFIVFQKYLTLYNLQSFIVAGVL
jgi:hypothetical protein